MQLQAALSEELAPNESILTNGSTQLGAWASESSLTEALFFVMASEATPVLRFADHDSTMGKKPTSGNNKTFSMAEKASAKDAYAVDAPHLHACAT